MTAQPVSAPASDANLARLDRNAPRYTSFPTAAQFTPAVGEAEARRWLAALPDGEPVSLYVHLPFCKRLCWYCGCNTRAVNRREVISSYVELIGAEARMTAEAAGRRLRVACLHLGGGTPNMLSPEDLNRLFDLLGSAFDLDAADEIAAELDPATLTEAWVQAATDRGLTRASLGVQDLSPVVQQAVNRIEPFGVVERAAGWLRAAGVRSLNLDLMYGLPEQGVRDVLRTLDQVLTLRPDRIALFGYAHVPWMKPHQRLIDETRLPDTAQRLAQSQAAADKLWDAGYAAIGIDHFALPSDSLARAARAGRLHRNFQGYTDDGSEALIGLGASSISRTAEGYWQNHTAELAWRTTVAEKCLPVARGVQLTQGDRLRAEIIERLMCDFAVDLLAVCASHGAGLEMLRPDLLRLAVCEAEGLAASDHGRVQATPAGRRFVRLVAAAFDPYFDAAANRHARVS